MTLAFYVSGKASRLLLLFSNRNEFHELIDKISLIVYDGNNKPTIEALNTLCLKYRIIFKQWSGDKLPRRKDPFSNWLYDLFIEYQIDYCFCFGDRILFGSILNNYKNRIINFHPSLLPSFPGLNAIDKALDSNAFLLGNTAHFIDNGVDTGPVIMQSVIHRQLFINYEDVLSLQLPMMLQIFHWLLAKRIKINHGRVDVFKANYSPVGTFIPQLEISYE